MTLFKEHPCAFQTGKAFMRVKNTPQKVVFFNLLYNHGYLVSFNKHKNVITRALLVLQHDSKPPTIIKFEGSAQEKEVQLKLVLCPEKREVALYVKSDNQEYVDYFHPEFGRKSRLWALFGLPDGTYGILFDSDKYSIDFGFTWVSKSSPDPFDLMSMGLQSTFKI